MRILRKLIILLCIMMLSACVKDSLKSTSVVGNEMVMTAFGYYEESLLILKEYGYKKALAYFEKTFPRMLMDNEKTADLYYNFRALLRFDAHLLREAYEDFKKADAIYYKNYGERSDRYCYFLGLMNRRFGYYEDTLKDWNDLIAFYTASKIDSQIFELLQDMYFNVIDVYRCQNNMEAALAMLEEKMRVCPEPEADAFELAYIKGLMGDVSDFPEDFMDTYYYAHCSIDIGLYDRGERILTEILTEKNDSLKTMGSILGLGYIELLRGNVEAAYEFFQAALEIEGMVNAIQKKDSIAGNQVSIIYKELDPEIAESFCSYYYVLGDEEKLVEWYKIFIQGREYIDEVPATVTSADAISFFERNSIRFRNLQKEIM